MNRNEKPISSINTRTDNDNTHGQLGSSDDGLDCLVHVGNDAVGDNQKDEVVGPEGFRAMIAGESRHVIDDG